MAVGATQIKTATEANIADVLPEPADGTYLVCVEYDGTRTLIWRDDAARTSKHKDERWLSDYITDPMAWREILRYATAVHRIYAEPLARMPEAQHAPDPIDDGATLPFAQDTDGMWHKRPADDTLWTPPPAETQCATVCGTRIASKNLASTDPRKLELVDNKTTCIGCFPPKEA
jgi:hypothetical protein